MTNTLQNLSLCVPAFEARKQLWMVCEKLSTSLSKRTLLASTHSKWGQMWIASTKQSEDMAYILIYVLLLAEHMKDITAICHKATQILSSLYKHVLTLTVLSSFSSLLWMPRWMSSSYLAALWLHHNYPMTTNVKSKVNLVVTLCNVSREAHLRFIEVGPDYYALLWVGF